MSEKRVLITFAVLDAALGALQSSAKGTAAEEAANKLKSLFNDFREQPAPAAPFKDLSADLEQAKVVITELKGKIAELSQEKAASAPKNLVEVNKVKYLVKHGAHPHSVQDIIDNPDLAKEILKITGQNAIVKF